MHLRKNKFVPKICVVGLGYVGLPLVVEFAKNEVEVWGFDLNPLKIRALENHVDPSVQVASEELADLRIQFSGDPSVIQKANFVIVAVPTPINDEHLPDLGFLESASKLVGENLSEGTVIVYESTVYPGVTEEVCIPIVERYSGLRHMEGFFVGYSPERVNPGDADHTIDRIVKVVSGCDDDVTELVASVYSLVIKAGVVRAKNIRTAEAAKVIENIQRDLNIALINELALIFSRLGINTRDVLEAASTKWNFHKYTPGLVGGHCIGVDPYYLVYKARQLGYEPEVLLAGRKVNEYMARFVAEETINMLRLVGKNPFKSKVLILGLTFKENINDVRNSKAKDLIGFLRAEGVEVLAHDPYVDDAVVEQEFGVKNFILDEVLDFDAVILYNAHDPFKAISPKNLAVKMTGRPVLFDVKSFFDANALEELNFLYKTL